MFMLQKCYDTLKCYVYVTVSTKAEQEAEGHRCYWCGPLAEQVHRSQRASTCSGDKSKVTICDEDLPFCAIVATSPRKSFKGYF